jgi:hypothetical protein
MKRVRIGAVAALIAGAGMVGAPVAGHAQSLSDLFDQIKNAIVAEGAVGWEAFEHDSNPQPGYQSDWTYQRRTETSNFSYDIQNCTFAFHYRVTTNGSVSSEVEGGVPLRLASTIRVAPEAQLVEQRDAQSGHPSWATRLQPEIYDVQVTRTDGLDNVFSFYNIDNANRVSQLFRQARSLCDAHLGGAD